MEKLLKMNRASCSTMISQIGLILSHCVILRPIHTTMIICKIVQSTKIALGNKQATKTDAHARVQTTYVLLLFYTPCQFCSCAWPAFWLIKEVPPAACFQAMQMYILDSHYAGPQMPPTITTEALDFHFVLQSANLLQGSP